MHISVYVSPNLPIKDMSNFLIVEKWTNLNIKDLL